MPNNTMATQFTTKSAGVFEVIGDLTYQTVNPLQNLPEHILTNQSGSTILLNKVQQIDSAGLALLIDWKLQSMKHQPIRFNNPTDQLLRLVNLYNLENTLSIESK